MSDSNVKFGSGGRLYSDATRDGDGLPWGHDGENEAPPLPNKVVPKVLDPTAPPPASSARSGSLRDVTSTVLELAGLASISLGFFLVSPAVGFIVMGIALVALGMAGGRQ